MLNGKRVAVVLPAYNAATTLKRSLDELDHDVVDDVVPGGRRQHRPHRRGGSSIWAWPPSVTTATWATAQPEDLLPLPPSTSVPTSS